MDKVNRIIWTFIIILFIFCPDKYSWNYCLACFILYAINLYGFFKFKEKENYFDFETIFLLCFTITGFAYPLVIYDDANPFLPFFLNTFDINVISKGTICSTIAGCLFMEGAKKTFNLNCQHKTYKLKFGYFFIIAIVSLAVFYLQGGFEYYANRYAGEVAVESSRAFQMQIFIQCATLALSTYVFYRRGRDKLKAEDLYVLGFAMLVALMFVLSGNRTVGMVIALPIMFYFFDRYYPLSIYKFSLAMVAAFVAMFAIQIARAGFEFDIKTVGFDNAVSDLVIPSRANYLVYECVKKDGYSLGLTMLSNITEVIPSLNSFLVAHGVDISGSAEYITAYTDKTGGYANTGLGTTLQASVQFAFGYIGLILFYYLGKFVNTIHYRMKSGDYYSFYVYSGMMSVAVFLVRTDLFYPFRLIVWTLILVKIFSYTRVSKI